MVTFELPLKADYFQFPVLSFGSTWVQNQEKGL